MTIPVEMLSRYMNRQLVLNKYVEDELVERDGLHIDHVVYQQERLEIYKDGRLARTIPIAPSAKFIALEGFKDHYAFVEGDSRLELYFPH